MRFWMLLACLAWLWAGPANADRLVVFVDGGGSSLQRAFAEGPLPGLRELSDQLGVELVVFDLAERGVAPQGVGLTPLIAFQNWRGTSIYQGRSTTLDRVKNFVRTARFMPQGDAPLVREDVPVWDRGAMKVAIVTKITPFVGPGVENGRFADGAEAATARAGAVEAASAGGRFTRVERVELGRSDRTWYVDLYPYVAEDGTVFVSGALFSQFHCHEPVTAWTDAPTRGSAAEALASAMVRAEAEIARQVAESSLGDGFDVVSVPVVSWEDAGLALPEKPAPVGGAAAVEAEFQLPGAWTVDTAAQDEQPAVQFTWPPPVDAYSGEAQRVTGSLRLGGDAERGWTYASLSGWFVAEAASVTMGEADLDAYVRSGILEAGEHPEPAFVIERADVEPAFADQSVTLGELVPITLHGRFTLKGVAIPLTVPMSVEAFVGDDGQPRLSFTGQWSLPLDTPWNIEGPPGPKEVSRTMLFACRIVLEPAE